ncbi:branched-chain amino acid ABC transporter permease [Nocardioides acrostichi]|uniref:Branched-chain amino acid ABC transporter permease n=1 Tax=Nocardioides acrostichi TaxID=2784339 RepID=A0A930UZX9_9ACTN|nr:branched-chain amino acid ABC transporter permease [Nocardioides acrostichi]MBF4160669.1 branched-chain amino acid ABC transporter permease [Nocardioides acrostichi]
MDQIFAILNATVSEAIAPATAGVAIAVIGLNLHFGFTGLLNIGQAGFMLLGAYGMAISVVQGVPMFFAVLIGLGLAILFATILGAPTLKLRGDYLAIVTISAAEIIRYVGRLAQFEKCEWSWCKKGTDFTGGSQGITSSTFTTPFKSISFFGDGAWTLSPFNYTSLGGSTAVRVLGLLVFLALVVGTVFFVRARRAAAARSWTDRLVVAVLVVLSVATLLFVFPQTMSRTQTDGWWVRAVAWTLVAVSTIVVLLLVRSPWGRLLRGIREDEEAMRSLGKNVFAVKMQALIIGGLFGALGGMVYVLASSVQADSLGRQITFFAYTALLIGGAASIFGPVLGTVIFYSARILIREAARTYVPNSILSDNQAQAFSFVVVGVILMLIVIFRPQGILGNKRELRFHV